MDSIFHIVIKPEDAGQRLDTYLSQHLQDLSRTRIKNLIDQGHIQVEGVQSPPSLKLKSGMVIHAILPEPVDAEPEAQDIALDIVFEDDHVLVINKPAGMVVHPAYGHNQGTLVNALLAHCPQTLSGIGGVKRPGIVHRLDRGTSGLMVVAKGDQAHQALSSQFVDRTLKRIYLALTWGVPIPNKGIVQTHIGRNPHNWRQQAVRPMTDHTNGKLAITEYTMQKRFQNFASQIECSLQTGRTHQIRVHMTHIGCPLIGDPEYGQIPKTIAKSLKHTLQQLTNGWRRPCLHAAHLEFIHPITQNLCQFDAPPPQDFLSVARVLADFDNYAYD